MTGPTPEVIYALVRPMSDDSEVDLTTLDADTLASFGRAARRGQALSGRVAAQLYRQHGWTFARIGEALGVSESWAYRLAKPYLPPKTTEEETE